MVPLSARGKAQQRLIDNSEHLLHLQQGYQCVSTCAERACACVRAGSRMRYMCKWQADFKQRAYIERPRRGTCQTKWFFIVSSVEMPAFLTCHPVRDAEDLNKQCITHA